MISPSKCAAAFTLFFCFGGSALADLDRSKEAQAAVEAMEGTTASLWLSTKFRYSISEAAGSKYVRFSNAIFTNLAGRNLVSVETRNNFEKEVELAPSISALIDDRIPSYTTHEGRRKHVYFKLGIYSDIAVLDVGEMIDDPDCEWQVTYRGWIADTTIISEAVSETIGADGEEDGHKFWVCYKVGREGLEQVYEDIVLSDE